MERLSERTRNCKYFATQKAIEYLKSIEYTYESHADYNFDSNIPIFTILICVFDRIEYFKIACESALNQTYENVEIILCNQQGTEEVSTHCQEIFRNNGNVKLINTKGRKFIKTEDMINYPIHNLWNAGLFCSEGDFIHAQSDDDLLSENFAECIVKLFNNNKNCIAAGGAIRSIDGEGNDTHRNYRLPETKYISGIDMMIGYIENNPIYSSPGGFLTFNTDKLINVGGYDYIPDTSQILRIAVLGDVGCDKKATFNFRHHGNNSNIQFDGMGALYYAIYKEWYDNYKIYEFYKENLGDELAQKVNKYWKYLLNFEMIFYNAKHAIRMGGFKSLILSYKNIKKECPHLLIKWLIYIIYHAILFTFISLGRKSVNNLLKLLGLHSYVFIRYGGGTFVKLGEIVPEYEMKIFPNFMKKKYGGQTLKKIENGTPFSSFGEIELPGINWVTVGISLLVMDVNKRLSKETLFNRGKRAQHHNVKGCKDLEQKTRNSVNKENNNDESDEKDIPKLRKA